MRGIRIDIGELLDGNFPIVGIDEIGVSVTGNLFGGQVSATLIGGILRVSDAGQVLDTFDRTTPVADRILYVAVEGGFTFQGIGASIRFAISELGPLGVQISGLGPGSPGALRRPDADRLHRGRRVLQDPAVDRRSAAAARAAVLRRGHHGRSRRVDGLDQDADRAPVAAAAGQPRDERLRGRVHRPDDDHRQRKLYSIYASQAVFNGIVTVKISTDGKFLIAGQLDFAADNISISAKLYADLSKVANGEVAILFLADVPDQVRVLTLYGRLKTGFRNPSGQEVLFVAPSDAPLVPRPGSPGRAPATSSGARRSTSAATSTSATRPAPASASTPRRSPTSATSSRSARPAARVVLDRTQAPVLIDPANNVWRYWTISRGNVTGVAITAIENSWVVSNLSTGENVGNGGTQALVLTGQVAIAATLTPPTSTWRSCPRPAATWWRAR